MKIRDIPGEDFNRLSELYLRRLVGRKGKAFRKSDFLAQWGDEEVEQMYVVYTNGKSRVCQQIAQILHNYLESVRLVKGVSVNDNNSHLGGV